MALVKYNNNSISAVTALDSIASGSLVLLATNTITSGVASSSFTSNIDSTYNTYLFKFISIHGATDGSEFTVNFRDGSSAFDATKTTTAVYIYHAENGGSATGSYKADGDIAQGTGYQRLMDGSVSGADNDQSLCGEMFLFSPSSTTFVKHFISRTNSAMSWDASGNYFVTGYCNVTAAIDGVDFKFSSGNIDSGVIKMYGLRES
jgi:hypothetical protein